MRRLLLFGFMAAVAVSAQDRGAKAALGTPPVKEKPLAFEVASIKPANSSGGNLRSEPGLRFLPGGVASLPAGVTAKQLIVEAYQITGHQLAGGPGWIGSDRFTLNAKAKGDAVKTEICLMLQTLLSERFNLVVRRSVKQMRVYALTVRKGGPGPARYQVKAAAANSGSTGFHKADSAFEGHTGGRAAAFAGTTMELFARSLSELGSSFLGRPVIDRTGLQGLFNLRLAWNDDDDFMTALQDELGLRLESQQAQMDVLVIDHIEKPSAN